MACMWAGGSASVLLGKIIIVRELQCCFVPVDLIAFHILSNRPCKARSIWSLSWCCAKVVPNGRLRLKSGMMRSADPSFMTSGILRTSNLPQCRQNSFASHCSVVKCSIVGRLRQAEEPRRAICYPPSTISVRHDSTLEPVCI